MKNTIETYKKNAVFCDLNDFDILAKKCDFIEITEWKNGDGFDVDIGGTNTQMFQLTRGQFNAMKVLIKKLNTNE